MKLKKCFNSKNFSKILALGILLNSLPINSFASVLSRYEMFEGNNITINDILEEDKIDVEIEGNTLVNIADSSQSNVSSELKGWKLNLYSDRIATLNLRIDMLKPNTEYTVVLIGDMNKISGSATTLQNVTENDNHVIGSSVYYSKYKYKITTNSLVHNSDKTHPIYLIPHIYPLEGEVFTQTQLDNLDLKVMVFEGDLTNIDTPDEYFFGMKSVGEDDKNGHKIDILSNNGNIYNYNIMEIGMTHDNGTNYDVDIGYVRVSNSYKIPVKPNTTYYFNKSNWCVIHMYDKNQNHIFYEANISRTSFTTPPNCYYIRFRNFSRYSASELAMEEAKTLTLSETSPVENYITPQSNKKEVLIKNPLRGLPNGVRDKIIKKNGLWFIERNIHEIILTGDESWIMFERPENVNVVGFYTSLYPRAKGKDNDLYQPSTLCDKFLVKHIYSNEEKIYTHASNVSKLSLVVNKSKLNSLNPEGLSEWLKNNPVTVVYQLETPIYEPINFDTVQLYLGNTHISTNSTIPANLKLTVDRVTNRAKEFSKLAKENPTLYNISLARMWINLMRESILKDEFHNTIDTITEVTDITVEKKKASANLDLYIKSENLLSMSLNTNSISFEDFSGVEDMTKDSDVNISINSSLPYNLNSYLATDVQNSDKSNTINLDILSIKENSELSYQKFSAINNKLILKSNCESGNNKQHNIDLKLNAGVAHEKDVYKTTIKFEAEQI